MKTTLRTSLCTIGFLAILVLVGRVQADWITLQNPVDSYGKVSNTPAGICAAAATINSFVYLRTQYPTAFQGLLPDWDGDGDVDNDDYVTSRDKIANGWTHDGSVRKGIYGIGSGMPDKDWWETKVYWIEDFGPGFTVLDGQVYNRPGCTDWHRGNVLENTYPQWAFLWNELEHKEDIELGIYPKTGGAGHAITLTSLKFNDLGSPGNGRWDPATEEAKIDYLDPNDTSQVKWATVSLTGSRLEFEWWQDSQTWYIDHAWTESIPEPATLGLLALGGFILARRRRAA
ncbi:MAG: PEP-CTERM sorting domain-containing protein [Phycisphaerae bacterium]|nr:PEP-CTERM sorting domain-containing protein [Phycisphaerae bacterium]